MTTYMPRSAWTSTAPGGATLTGAKLVGLAVHWPGSTTNAFGVESAEKIASRLRGWRDYHVNVKRWADIGYNVAVDQAGRVWDLRGITRVGAHVASDANPDANHEYVGVLLILGDEEKPTAAMVEAFRHFRTTRFLPRWSGRFQIRGHRQVPGAQTACPGPAALALVNDGTLAGAPGTTEPEDDMPATVTNPRTGAEVPTDEALSSMWEYAIRASEQTGAVQHPTLTEKWPLVKATWSSWYYSLDASNKAKKIEDTTVKLAADVADLKAAVARIEAALAAPKA